MNLPFPQLLYFIVTSVIIKGIQASLQLSLHNVSGSIAQIHWSLDMDSEERGLLDCELMYQPIGTSNAYVLLNFLPLNSTFEIRELDINVSYQIHMTCLGNKGHKYISNNLTISTAEFNVSSYNIFGDDSKVKELCSDPIMANVNILTSSDVVLGVVFGVIGLLIINMTAIMLLKKYRQLRYRRQMIEMNQDRDRFADLQDMN